MFAPFRGRAEFDLIKRVWCSRRRGPYRHATRAKRVSGCADDRRLSMWLHENRHVGGIRRKRRHGHVEAPDLTLPRAQGANATHDIELLEIAAGVFPASNRGNRMAQVGNEHHIADRKSTRLNSSHL